MAFVMLEDYWGETFSDHVQNTLKMESLHGDPWLHLKRSGSETIGLLGSYVGDSLFAGNPEFNADIAKTMQKFETKPLEWDDFEFVGVTISTVFHTDGKTEFQIKSTQLR